MTIGGVSSSSFDPLIVDADDLLDLDARGKPTKRASRLNAHSELFYLDGQQDPLTGFAAVMARQQVAPPPVAARASPPRRALFMTDLAPETIEREGKRVAPGSKPVLARPLKPFEIEKTVGAATAERDPDQRKRRQPMPFGGTDLEKPSSEPRKPFVLERKPQPAGKTPFVQVAVNEEMAEWERALLLPEEKPGVVPLLSRAPNEDEPVRLSGRGPQRGVLPTIRRPTLPEPKVPSTKVIATAKTMGKRAFSAAVAQGGKQDPRMESRPKVATGGHAGRV